MFMQSSNSKMRLKMGTLLSSVVILKSIINDLTERLKQKNRLVSELIKT